MAGESASESARRIWSKSEALARTAQMYERGAAGERATAAVLGALPREQWTVFHDLRWPGRRFANVDHVVVGPPGVFVIDSKNWSGKVTVRAGVLRQDGRKRETAVAGAAEAALAVAQLTGIVTPEQVHPVLCFVRSEPVTGRARDVILCSTANVLEMLQTRPRALTDDTVRRLCLDLDASFRAAAAAVREPQGRAIRTQSPRSRSMPMPGNRPLSTKRKAKSRRPLAKLTGFVATISVMMAMLTTDLPDHIAHLLISVMTPDGTARSPGTDGSEKKKQRPPDGPRRQQRQRSDRN